MHRVLRLCRVHHCNRARLRCLAPTEAATRHFGNVTQLRYEREVAHPPLLGAGGRDDEHLASDVGQVSEARRASALVVAREANGN